VSEVFGYVLAPAAADGYMQYTWALLDRGFDLAEAAYSRNGGDG
jgi:hypothetical protein